MLLYQSIYYSAHSHLSNRCEAIQQHYRVYHGQITRLKYNGGEWKVVNNEEEGRPVGQMKG
jgi:hypothetical protein